MSGPAGRYTCGAISRKVSTSLSMSVAGRFAPVAASARRSSAALPMARSRTLA